MSLQIFILAAGKGTRMRSDKPKVLHEIGGQAMLRRVYNTACGLRPACIHIVYGFGGDQIRASMSDLKNVDWVYQAEQLGTGHAVRQAMPNVKYDDIVLVIYGDTPLLSVTTLGRMVAAVPDGGLAVLTANFSDPTGFGRIVRDSAGAFDRIVEQKDASSEELKIHEINTGVCVADAGVLRTMLNTIGRDNAQHEYYLTDVFSIARRCGMPVVTVTADDPEEVLGVNSCLQQAKVEKIYQRKVAEKLMTDGVTIIDPDRINIRGNLTCGRDVVIDINAVFIGDVVLGDRVTVGPNCVLKDCEIGTDSVISPCTVIEGSKLGRHVTIGPFARLRPGCELKEEVHVGNFVECKNATLGEGTKSGHLTYLGDATLGRGVNIGAGTITCNYDGLHKFKTVIGDDVFVGSDTQIVAPVTVGDGVTIGAGTTVTKDISDDMLVITRAPRRDIPDWKRPGKKDRAPKQPEDKQE